MAGTNVLGGSRPRFGLLSKLPGDKNAAPEFACCVESCDVKAIL